jgi:hypothetical protein
MGADSVDRTFCPDFVGPRHRLRESLLIRCLLSGKPGARVVNVGAGQGTLSELLEQRGFLVTSVNRRPKQRTRPHIAPGYSRRRSGCSGTFFGHLLAYASRGRATKNLVHVAYRPTYLTLTCLWVFGTTRRR